MPSVSVLEAENWDNIHQLVELCASHLCFPARNGSAYSSAIQFSVTATGRTMPGFRDPGAWAIRGCKGRFPFRGLASVGEPEPPVVPYTLAVVRKIWSEKTFGRAGPRGSACELSLPWMRENSCQHALNYWQRCAVVSVNSTTRYFNCLR